MTLTKQEKKKGPNRAATRRSLASHPEDLTNQKELISMYTNVDESTTPKPAYIDVPCTRDHCDRQGQMHRLDMSMFNDVDEARAMVSHGIDLGGDFIIDAIGDAPWCFFTNHDEIFPNEIEVWIEQANAAAKLCLDLNQKANA